MLDTVGWKNRQNGGGTIVPGSAQDNTNKTQFVPAENGVPGAR